VLQISLVHWTTAVRQKLTKLTSYNSAEMGICLSTLQWNNCNPILSRQTQKLYQYRLLSLPTVQNQYCSPPIIVFKRKLILVFPPQHFWIYFLEDKKLVVSWLIPFVIQYTKQVQEDRTAYTIHIYLDTRFIDKTIYFFTYSYIVVRFSDTDIFHHVSYLDPKIIDKAVFLQIQLCLSKLDCLYISR